MTNNNTSDNSQSQVVVFKRPKLNNNGRYSLDEFEDIFYKDTIDVNGKHFFKRVSAPKNNNNNKIKEK